MNARSDERVLEFTVERGGERLDKVVVAALGNVSRSLVQRLIRAGRITVDGQPARPNTRPEAGARIVARVPPPPSDEALPEDIPLVVLYEDDDLAAVDKPSGMVVHPAYGHRSGTLVNAALHRWPQLQSVGPPGRNGIVHRLDKETSGVILLAKTEPALAALQEQFRARRVEKVYLALVHGCPDAPAGRIEAPLKRDPQKRQRMAVLAGGREAITEYKVRQVFETASEPLTLLEARPRSGRMHQIRLHLAFIGHPVVSDTVYGRRRRLPALPRFFLHAWQLSVDSPGAGRRLHFEAPLPPELTDLLARLAAGYNP